MPPHTAAPRALPPCTDASMPLRVSDLSGRKPHRFQLTPDAGARAQLAEDLGLLALRKCDFRGTLSPEGRHDWLLEGRLGATVVQPCIITAEAVSTRIDTDVIRRFRRDLPVPEAAETEMPEDDTIEPLGAVIDPGAVMAEALALALPDYPRAAGAALDEASFAPPGTEPLSETRPNPFAALAALRSETPPPSGDGSGQPGEGESAQPESPEEPGRGPKPGPKARG